MDRYLRQSVFQRIGPHGQKKLEQARVAIVGIGALGTVIANNLARAGIGYLRLIDRDCVELHNLHRQMIFSEDNAHTQLPKAIAAQQFLAAANSEIKIDAIIVDYNTNNALSLLETIDLVVDGTDNRETRCLIDEACHATGVPWIYGGVLGSLGMTMNIIPGKTACYHCLTGNNDHNDSIATCSTSGVLNMITSIIASYQSAEAIKILLHDPDTRSDLLCIDVWTNDHLDIHVEPKPDCPVCQLRQYRQLSQPRGCLTQVLCGQDAVQVVPGSERIIDFRTLSAKLEKICDVKYNSFMLTLQDDNRKITIFRDGRAIVHKVRDENQAKGIYVEYFGL